MCRKCKYYRPDERYRGVIGMCERHNKITDVKTTCKDKEPGKQRWMNGKEVQE